jgi:hypothetical protein
MADKPPNPWDEPWYGMRLAWYVHIDACLPPDATRAQTDAHMHCFFDGAESALQLLQFLIRLRPDVDAATLTRCIDAVHAYCLKVVQEVEDEPAPHEVRPELHIVK